MTATSEHPRWCSPRHCSVTDANLPLDGGEHRSEPIRLDPCRVFTSRGAVRATSAYLTNAACAWKTETFLHLATDDDELTLPISRAAGLLHQLAELVSQDAPSN